MKSSEVYQAGLRYREVCMSGETEPTDRKSQRHNSLSLLRRPLNKPTDKQEFTKL